MKTILKTILFLIAVTQTGLAISGELEKADALYHQGKFKEALAIYLKPEYREKARVQIHVGNIYLQKGFIDEKKSTEWFQKAADQDDAKGIYNLALAYQEGLGVPKDNHKALQLLRKAADQGLPSAMNSIGFMYKNGLGVEANEKEAANWYLKAAQGGNALGQCNIAGCYMYGTAVAKDYEKAHDLLNQCLRNDPDNDCCLDRLAELYSGGWGVKRDAPKAHALREKAAANGSEVAMYMLGRDYDYGIGATKDPRAALDWYEKAAAKNHAKAQYRLYEIYEYGKLGQSVDKARAAEWKAKAEATMKEQGLSRNKVVDYLRLMME